VKKLIISLIYAITAMAILAPAAPDAPKKYICPSCGCAADNRIFDKPGTCPECGMALIEQAAEKKTEQKTTVAVLLFDGAEIIDYAGPWEAFGEAGFKVFTVAENTKPINATFGQKIVADYTFENSPRADVLLIPGGAVKKSTQNEALLKWVQKNAQASEHVMSVCTGAFILAKAGLLDGLMATTVNHAIDDLAKVSSKIKVVRDQRYVDNGKIITTAGLSSGIDGAFHVIEKIRGRGEAQSTALGMEYRWSPDSKFARAALADTYFPDLDDVDGEILSTEGDVDHWQTKALVSKPDSVVAILDLLSKKLVTSTPRTRGPVTLVSSNSSQDNRKSEMTWKFTDEQGHNWSGQGIVEAADGHPGKFLVTLKLAREKKST
jgi:putative intracellular protease/amidase